jgi:hypothetical protein
MSNKSQALSLFHDTKFAPEQICAIGAICRRHLEEIQRAERVTAQRAITLGVALWKIRLSLSHGQWMPWQAEHLGVGQRQVNYYMRLALVFLIKSRATKVELRALPADSIELAPTDALSRALFARLEKFVGECSLNELLVKHGIKGITRDTDDQANADATTAGGEQMLFPEMCDVLLKLDRLYMPESIGQVPPDKLKPLRSEWENTKARIDANFEQALGRKPSQP